MKVNKSLLWAVLAVGGLGAIAVGQSTAMVIVGTGALLLGAGKLLRHMSARQNVAAIRRALREYDAIIDGVRWIGKDAEALTWDRVNSPDDGDRVRIHQVCRTQKGSWFFFEVVVRQGRVFESSLTPCTEVQAQFQLQHHKDVYVRFFGQPTVA